MSDLRDIPEGLREARVAEAAAEAARRPFDLDRGPLWRLELLRWADEGHDLVLVMHHLVSDAWSFAVFGRELAKGYASAVAGRPPGLADLPISYAEFGQRQRRWLSGPSSCRGMEIWRGRLAGEVPSLWLPADRPGGSTMDHRGSFRPVSVPSPTAAVLAELSRREQATPFMTLLAAFAALLHRRGGQEDQVHCTPASGRHRSGARDLIGYFNNILPLRLDLRGDPPFVELVRRVRRVALEAYKHQDLPFQIIADAPNLGRSASAGCCSRSTWSGRRGSRRPAWPARRGRSASRPRISTCPPRSGRRTAACAASSSTRRRCSTARRSSG